MNELNAEMNGVPGGNGKRGRSWRLLVWGGAAALLLLPLVAMQFTDEVDWTSLDFTVFGTMLVLAGGAVELALRLRGDFAYRAAAALAVATAFLLTWANLAVGIIGSENHPANVMYFGVVAVAIAGALVARGRPRGMAGALTVTAAAQAGTAVVALVTGLQNLPESSVAEILVVNGCFTALFLGSALLFRRADRNGKQSRFEKRLPSIDADPSS
jgi:hypothetical protein